MFQRNKLRGLIVFDQFGSINRSYCPSSISCNKPGKTFQYSLLSNYFIDILKMVSLIYIIVSEINILIKIR